MQSIINYAYGGESDMSNYAKKTDIEKDLISLTVSNANIGATYRNGNTSSWTVNNVAHATKADQDGSGNTITATYAKTADIATTYAKKSDLATVATTGSYNDLKDKPSTPSEYTLPTASATTLGGVKVGKYLDITDGVLSAPKIEKCFVGVEPGADGNLYFIKGDNTKTSTSVMLSAKAYQDGNGNNIVNTYAKKTEIPTKVSELTNDGVFVTEAKVQEMIDAIVSADGKEY